MARSTAHWKSSLQARAGTSIHLLAQKYPVSVGQTLLVHDRLDLLWDAMSFDNLRLETLRISGKASSGQKCCLLCGGVDHGLAHLLAECICIQGDRHTFLSAEGGVWYKVLSSALPGDWPTAVLSPHAGLKSLIPAVRYAGAVERELLSKSMPLTNKKMSLPFRLVAWSASSVCVCFLVLVPFGWQQGLAVRLGLWPHLGFLSWQAAASPSVRRVLPGCASSCSVCAQSAGLLVWCCGMQAPFGWQLQRRASLRLFLVGKRFHVPV